MALPILALATGILQGYKILRDGTEDIKAIRKIPHIVRDKKQTRFSRFLSVADIVVAASVTVLALRGLKKGSRK